MADQEARREARRQKILQNSENRLNRLLGMPTTSQSEFPEASDETSSPDFRSESDSADFSSTSTTPGCRGTNALYPTLVDSETSTATTRQRAHGSTPSEIQQKLSVTEQRPETAPYQADRSRNGVSSVPGKDESVSANPVKLLDLIRCGSCLLAAFLTRWSLSCGLGILFLEWVIVPFIVLEGSLYYFQTTHMKDIKLPHKNVMMTYALVLSGIKPDLVARYNSIMGYVSAVTEDFALYLFSFLLFHSVVA